MKTPASQLPAILAAAVFATVGLFASDSQPSTLNTQLRSLSFNDRAALATDLRELADDTRCWLWIEYYEVGMPTRNPDAYLSAYNFARLQATRQQALRDAAYIVEHYAPAAQPPQIAQFLYVGSNAPRYVGEPTTLVAIVAGEELRYEWIAPDGTIVARTPYHTFTPASTAQGGGYQCRVINPAGIIEADLAVEIRPAIAPKS
jgi:hypothetical protein